MEFGQLLSRLWTDPVTNNAIVLLFVVPVVDLLTGAARAIANSTFHLALLDTWVRTKIAGRAIPIVLVLLFGTVVGNIAVGDWSFNVLTVAAIAAAATFLATEATSIVANISPTVPDGPPRE